jgi:hypothetical protein
MRRRFDSKYIESELRRVGRQLETELTVYLIGGGAMSFRGLKETTKDIDLIVSDDDDFRVLQAVLLSSGYDIVQEPGEEYDDLGAQRILENDDGCRIDIFNQQVIDKLVLSEGMCRRSEAYLDAGGLSVALVRRLQSAPSTSAMTFTRRYSHTPRFWCCSTTVRLPNMKSMRRGRLPTYSNWFRSC